MPHKKDEKPKKDFLGWVSLAAVIIVAIFMFVPFTIFDPLVEKECNIKGNISVRSGEKIYHLPDQKWYNSTEIDTSKGEKYFCSEQEAIEAGWRKSKE